MASKLNKKNDEMVQKRENLKTNFLIILNILYYFIDFFINKLIFYC